MAALFCFQAIPFTGCMRYILCVKAVAIGRTLPLKVPSFLFCHIRVTTLVLVCTHPFSSIDSQKTMKRITTALMFMALSTAASAVEFTLPSGPDVSLAQIQSLSDFTTLCDSNTATDSVCEVPAGEYQLVVFDALWAATISTITVAPVASATPDAGSSMSMTTSTTGSRITLVTQSCFGGPNTRMGCTAF